MLHGLLLCSVLVAAPLLAQPPSIVHYGWSCPVSNSIHAQGLPQVGATFYITDTFAACVPPAWCYKALVIGFQQTSTPFFEPWVGSGNGCLIYTTHDVSLPLPPAGTQGIPIAIPNESALAGFQFYLQGVLMGVVSPFPPSLAFTDGLRCTVGM